MGNAAAFLIQKALPNGEDGHFESVFSAFRDYYAVHSGDHTCPYPGILTLLENLEKKGYLLAILSNKPDFAVQTLCREHFPQIRYCTGETKEIPRKPDPTGVLKMAQRLGVELKDCLYVGDSEVDIQTAKNANIPCVAVTWGFRDREDLEQEGCLHFAANTEELEKKIDEILRA